MGHFCWICMEEKPNEKFTGKGRRQSICKSCRKLAPELIKEMKESQKRAQHYMNNVKSGSVLRIARAHFYVFTYRGHTYASAGEYLDVVFHYIRKEDKLVLSEELSGNWDVSGVLLNGYYNFLENSHYVDYEGFHEHGTAVLTKRQNRHAAVFKAIYQELYIELPNTLSYD